MSVTTSACLEQVHDAGGSGGAAAIATNAQSSDPIRWIRTAAQYRTRRGRLTPPDRGARMRRTKVRPMKRPMLGVLIACSAATLIVDAQRRVKFDGRNEYTLTVQTQTPEQINAWWMPFQQQNSLEGYCWNLNTLPLADRPHLGDKAKILKVGGAGQLTQIIEIPPGKKTAWHGYGWEGEALFYVLGGRGQTEYRGMVGGLPSNRYTWKKNSLFAIAVDHEMQHTNLDPAQPVRLLAVTGYAINMYPFVSRCARRAPIGRRSST